MAYLTTDYTDVEISSGTFLEKFFTGKVKDIYSLGDELLLIFTDRFSCFNKSIHQEMLGKGEAQNKISAYWFENTKHIISNHLISTMVPDFMGPYSAEVEGRVMLVKKTKPLNFEFVVRGYLADSAWREYNNTGSVSGNDLDDDLEQSEKLSKPIFCVGIKNKNQVREYIDYSIFEKEVGKELAEKVRDKSLELYSFMHKKALEKGLILADTKLEFGLLDTDLILIDELGTPDSSRFWLSDLYKTGKELPVLGRQPINVFLAGLGWDETMEVPQISKVVRDEVAERYWKVLETLVPM